MKRHVPFLFLAVLIVMLMALISYRGTLAQTDRPGDPVNPPAVLTQGNETAQGGAPVLSPAASTALVSSAFTYQGLLRNSGAPVNVHCDFIWNIFPDLIGGTSLATDTDTNVLLTNGLFTLAIDVPASVIDGNQRFLEIQVRCPTGVGLYTTLSPRQELRAAPYALGLRLPFSHTINNNASPLFAITNTGGTDASPSILGSSSGGDGVQGKSTGAGSADNGVYGETNSTSSTDAAVKGLSTSSAAGGYFTGNGSYGVYGATDLETGFGGYFNNSSVTTSGAALYANGDARQSLAGDGFVKAGALVNCADSGSAIGRSFNNVNTVEITISDGSDPGRCMVDFGFNVSTRYVVALAQGLDVARFVTCWNGSTSNRIVFSRFDPDGIGKNGMIMIMIY